MPNAAFCLRSELNVEPLFKKLEVYLAKKHGDTVGVTTN